MQNPLILQHIKHTQKIYFELQSHTHSYDPHQQISKEIEYWFSFFPHHTLRQHMVLVMKSKKVH